MPSSGIDLIIRSVRELGEPIRVHGATSASQAYLGVHLISNLNGPWVFVCPSSDAAQEFFSDLETLSSLFLVDSPAISSFPVWEQSLYSSIAPSIRTRLERIAVLSALSQGRAKIVVTTLEASCQATLPQDLLRSSSLHLVPENSVESRDALVNQLLDCGYLRVDPVEDPGTFSVRGDIVDVFPVDRGKPIRIELYGDLIERMREFDSSSQRAAQDALNREIILPPAREVLINGSTWARIRENVKFRADDLGIPRPSRDPILASIQAGNYPSHSEAWAPFAYMKTETFWDYVPPKARVVWIDELSTHQEWDRFREELHELNRECPESNLIAPSPEQLYPIQDPAQAFLQNRIHLFLDRLDLADLKIVEAEDADQATGETADQGSAVAPSPRHSVFVRGNSDLSRGSKHSLGELEPKLRLWVRQGFKILALASTQSQLERIRFLLEERGLFCIQNQKPEPGRIALALGSLSEGFRWPSEGLVILTESEILGSRHVRRQRRAQSREQGDSSAKEWSNLQALSDLSVGDAVVHIDHGSGKYQGLARMNLSGAPSDFLVLEYANKDKLYLPVYRLNVIQKYVGSADAVTLDRLGSQQFSKTKEKVREAVKKLAVDLVQIYAERKVRPGIRFSPRDSLYREFEAKFPFDETPDQLRAIEEILGDVESGKVMDRLVCGDVGYGKTEVAMRAAFKTVSDGKQVAILVPTTVLAFQHEQSFKARLKDYPIRLDSLSRFKSAKEQKATLESLAAGKVDIIIGTHRLLSRDVKFNDLGLVIVDEEHRFGVEHKERLKTLKINTHVLTLTATPIPRTLHMALSGLRDISLIKTPPIDRMPIRTYVSKFDEALIQRAIQFELGRGGQVFFVHNRVQSIHEMANRIRELAPQASIGVGHGQMADGALEETMVSFYQNRINVLVCTSIIESGIDLPSANTIVINRADTLGLAQLYQIRGRVGRGQQRAYAYLLIPSEGAVTDEAKRRLEVIQRFVELGSGFNIASHDLEIRGGGDLLGPQQSGHIAAVGFDLYTELLEEAIREIEGRSPSSEDFSDPEIKAPFPAFLDEKYVPDIHQRLSLYRRCSTAQKDADVDHLEEELRDRFGPIPTEGQNLLWTVRLKQLLKGVGVETLTVGSGKITLLPSKASKMDPSRAIALISKHPDDYQITPDSKLVVKVSTESLRDLYFAVEAFLKKICH